MSDEVSPEIRQKTHKVCRQFLGGSWTRLPLDQFVINRISGGLSNYLYLCCLPEEWTTENGEPRQVLIRLYGEILINNTEFIVNDSVIFALLSEKQMGPKLFGVFQGGRMEEYIKSRCLRTEELAELRISKIVAQKLAHLHKLEMPTRKEPKFLFEYMKKWLSQSLDSVQLGTLPADLVLKYTKLHSYNLHTELRWLKNVIKKVPSPVLFCHNDLQEGNILCTKKTPDECELMVIDYEYANYNYRGFDIGNHFCEWMYNYTTDKPPYFTTIIENYPNKQQQLEFLRVYLKEMGEACTDEILEKMVIETNTYSLVAECFWGLWSLSQSQLSNIKFGYLDHALSRFEVYFEHKKLFPLPEENGSSS